jgi:nucleoside-diphosphate-sugar epimerase
VFPAFISALTKGNPPEVHWDGEQSRDFTFIDDVVAANLAAAEASDAVSGEVFNIAGGGPRTINEVLAAVSEFVGTWIEPTYTPKRSGDVRHTRADITKARRLLSWRPEAQWSEAVKATVAWFEETLR